MDHFENVNEPAEPRRIGVAAQFEDEQSNKRSLSPMALASLIAAVVGLPLMGIASVIALVLGVVALNQIADPTRNYSGKGLAIAGIVVGITGMLVAPLVIVMILLTTSNGYSAMRNASQGSTNIRMIHQGMVIYAQSNKDHFPGLNPNGSVNNIEVTNRYDILLDANYISPGQLIDFADNDPNIQSATAIKPRKGPPFYKVAPNNYSYAMLSIDQPGGRRDEWQDTSNSQAIVLSDRNTNPSDGSQPASIHDPNPGWWEGNVGWNDGHTTYEMSADIAQTQYGPSNHSTNDALFVAPTNNDALMVHDGK